LAGLVQFFRERLDFVAREIAHGLLKQLLFIAEFEIHGVGPHGGLSDSSAA
jgi:hypothetical protein